MVHDINTLSTIESKIYGTYSWTKGGLQSSKREGVLDHLISISSISETNSQMYHQAPLLLCYLVPG